MSTKNKPQLSCINDLLNNILGVLVLLKITFRSRYLQMIIRAMSIFKIFFQTQYGHYDFMVMSFGLTNAPTTFYGVDGPRIFTILSLYL